MARAAVCPPQCWRKEVAVVGLKIAVFETAGPNGSSASCFKNSFGQCLMTVFFFFFGSRTFIFTKQRDCYCLVVKKNPQNYYQIYNFGSTVITKAHVAFGETMKAVEAQTNLSTDLHSDINRKLPTGRKTYFLVLQLWCETNAATCSHKGEGVRCLQQPTRPQTCGEKVTRHVSCFWKRCDLGLFLSATKRPFPAGAADKNLSVPLLFVLGGGSKKPPRRL